MTLTQVNQSAQFTAAITDHPKVLVKYTATWCGPCKAITPYVEELATNRKDILFVEVDIDHADEDVVTGIASIPTFRAYENGKQAGTLLGANREKLLELVDAFPMPATPTPGADSSEFPY